MKKLLLYSLYFGLVVCCVSCNKLEQLFTYDISNETAVTIPPTGPISTPVGISTPDVTTSSSQAFANNNTNVNAVKNVYLKSMELTITSPPGQTFNFVKSVHIYVSTDSSNEIQLAYLDSIPSNVDSIALIPTQAVLDRYVKAPNYNLRVQAVISHSLTQDVGINIDSRFQVTANL